MMEGVELFKFAWAWKSLGQVTLVHWLSKALVKALRMRFCMRVQIGARLAVQLVLGGRKGEEN